MHQFGRYRTINSTANGANNTSFRSAYFSDARDLFTDEFFLVEINTCNMKSLILNVDAYHGPALTTDTNLKNEISDNSLSHGRMGNFWVELNAIQWLSVMGDGCVRRSRCVTNDVKIGGRF